MNERIEKLFDQATFDESRMVGGVYHPYLALQFAGEPSRYSITREQYHKFAELLFGEYAEELRRLHDGESIVLPVDREHAQAMVRVGMHYLEQNK